MIFKRETKKRINCFPQDFKLAVSFETLCLIMRLVLVSICLIILSFQRYNLKTSTQTWKMNQNFLWKLFSPVCLTTKFIRIHDRFVRDHEYRPKLVSYRNFFPDETRMAQVALREGKYSFILLIVVQKVCEIYAKLQKLAK